MDMEFITGQLSKENMCVSKRELLFEDHKSTRVTFREIP